ncbi:hypothetical protein Q9251_11170 [Alkalihalobacillus macyae]|nr:hypothetical protein [Alkalihalobacillus macyae]MDP4551442.1 hypothetical protein [Alkalihalobacillus macyae]
MLDSCGTSGTGETPQERKRRGGSPPAPRKASILEWKSCSYSKNAYEKNPLFPLDRFFHFTEISKLQQIHHGK